MHLAVFLCNLGMTTFQSRIWCRMIAASVDALRQAEARLCVQWPQFIGMLGAISKAKRRRSKGGSSRTVPLEEGVTAELGGHLDDIVASAKADHPLKQLGVRFQVEKLRRSPRLTGKRSKKADIVATSNAGEGIAGWKASVELVFEAKVLDAPAGVKDYLHSEEGIGRFHRKSEPYTEEKIAAMLAYTVEGEPSEWTERIRHQMVGPPAQAKELLLLDVPGESEQALSSRHERPHRQDGDVAILHFVLKFPGAAQAATGQVGARGAKRSRPAVKIAG